MRSISSQQVFDYTDDSDFQAEPGLGLDVSMLAMVHTKVALMTLLRDTESLLGDVDAQMIIWTNHARPQDGELFEKPMSRPLRPGAESQGLPGLRRLRTRAGYRRGRPMNYVISEMALKTIERECRRYPDAETGGILVGFREPDEGQVLVTHASGPGPRAERSAVHFVKDTPYLQSVLNLLFQYYQANYLGVWHKHRRVPSSGDVASAMDELADGKVGLDELLTPICILDGGRVDVFPFAISDGASRRVAWRAVPHDRLPSGRSAAPTTPSRLRKWPFTTRGPRATSPSTPK